MKLSSKWLLKTGIVAASFSFMVACDKAKDEENKANFIGTWLGAQCEAKDNGSDETEYRKDELVVGETTFSYSEIKYSDAACTTPLYKGSTSGSYKAGTEAASTTDVEGASPIDLKMEKRTMTPLSAEAVTFLNSAEQCGKTDWAIDTAVDVSTCDMSENNNNQSGSNLMAEGDDNHDDGPQIGSTWYQIFVATETDFFLGKERNDNGTPEDETDDIIYGKTPADRPTELSTDSMKKQ